MEGLNFNDIYGEQEINSLFEEVDESPSDDGGTGAQEDAPEERITDTTEKTTEVVNPEELFEEEGTKQPESVGSEERQGEKEDAVPEDGGTSPQNFYSSIAKACAVDGIFPNLDEETIEKAKDAEAFSDLIEAEVNARFDEKQQRILKALENGVEPDSIRQYESTLNFLNSLTEAQIIEDNEKGEELRQKIIYQDFLNKGYKPAQAQKLVQRTIDAGTDIEDAKDALQSNKEHFQNLYDEMLKDAQKEADKAKAERIKQEEKLKKSILEDSDLLGGMELSKDVRKKVYDNIARPVYKDPETGQYLTALQKYEMEHREDFIKYVGLFMTLTDGFKDFKSFTKAEVKKEMKKGLRGLEQALQQGRTTGGNMKLVGNGKPDTESYLAGGFKLAL